MDKLIIASIVAFWIYVIVAIINNVSGGIGRRN